MTYKSGELFLTLNKAVDVAVNQFDVDPVIARQEFEQKCYIPSSDYEKGFYDGLEKCRDIIEDAMNEDLHERAMSRYIDVDALYDFMNRANIPYNALIQEAIDFQPSISIVRCEECKWYENACTFFVADPFEQAPMEKNDFCSFGERSEDE